MSEMLANHHFMLRDYISAAERFEEELRHNKSSITLKKKLIICYTQIGKVESAIDTIILLNKKELQSIIHTDPAIEDCPCRDIIYKIETRKIFNPNLKNKYLVLGVLWMYCDIRKSIEYFELVKELDKNDTRIRFIIELLDNELKPKTIN